MNTRSGYPEFAQAVAHSGWSRCEELIKQFEDAWQSGSAPRIDDFLLSASPLRHALLVELIHIDLEFQLKSRAVARVENYLNVFPELAGDTSAVLDLLGAEYRLRRRYEDDIALDDYAKRFPHLSPAQLEQLPQGSRVAQRDRPAPPANTPEDVPRVPGYEIVSEIGRGGMGVVYLARQPSLDRHVALKFLPAEPAHHGERLDRFLHEARTASALNHPYICTVHALGEHEGRPFLVMEYVEGATLGVIAERRPQREDIIRWIAQAARALAAAHAAGVVHRDIKPENIMVRDDGFVKVLDFGLARRLPALSNISGPETIPGAMLGTIAYMSPEQARGEVAEIASDVFALGIVAYQLLTGQHPFDTSDPILTLTSITNNPVVPPARIDATIGAALSGVIEGMLHKNPRLRPTADEVQEALSALSDGRAIGETRDPARRPIVHREAELEILRSAWAAAEAGRGSMVCVCGEPGIGKTTLVEDFLEDLAFESAGCMIARGSCSERLAESEAYLPIIDALENLLRHDSHGTAARLMKIVAPSWYAHVARPAGEAQGELADRWQAASQQAMLREFCNFLQEISRHGTVALFFDDLHWSDLSTVDLLAHLGRQCRGLRILIIATYRPTEMLVGRHPFRGVKLELQGQGVCTELLLDFLTRDDVDRYLQLAFPGHDFPAELADLVHTRTEGNPLFMADLLRYLCERGVLAQTLGRWTVAQELPDLSRELPESTRGMIQRKLDRLDERDRQLLAAASVQGSSFDSLIVSDALRCDPLDMEDRLQTLERVHGMVRLLHDHELPDRSLSMRYAFVHVLYQQALYRDLLPTRRAALALALARSLEARHGQAGSSVNAQLACLYEVGRDVLEAARHFWLASLNAARVFAHGEAVGLARRGLTLLESLPASPERAALELQVQTTLGLQLQVTQGYAAPAARQAYTRARTLWEQTPGTAPLFPVLWGLWLYHKVRSELATAQQLAEELSVLARQSNDPDLALQAHQALGMTAFCSGRPAISLEHVEQAVSLYDPKRHGTHAFQFGQDPGVICKAYGAVVLWLLGFPDSAARQCESAIRMSQDLSPSSQAVAWHFASMVHQLRRDPEQTLSAAETCAQIASEHGFSFWKAGSAILRGWALVAQGTLSEGGDMIRQGLLDWQATGSVTYLPYYFGLLSETLSAEGKVEQSGQALDEALQLVEQTGEGLWAAELHRLRGELLLREHRADEPWDPAIVCFRQSLLTAQSQGAKSLELRAAISLARLDQQRQHASGESVQLLKRVCRQLAEGLQSREMQEATALLHASA